MRTSLWLLPARADHARLAPLVVELAEAFASPRFLPHLTLVGEVRAAGPALAGALEILAREVGPLVAAAESLEVAAPYHRALFVRLTGTPALKALREDALGSCGGGHGGAPWLPHVSLLYADRPAEEKRPWLARVAPRVPREIAFDRLAAVVTTGPVEGWRAVWEGRLGP